MCNRMNKLLYVLLATATVSVAQDNSTADDTCVDNCGCGTRGCEALRTKATCNSMEDHAWRSSSCGNENGVLDCQFAQIRRKPAANLKIAFCEMGVGPKTAVTIATSALAFVAWLPLLSWTMQPQ